MKISEYKNCSTAGVKLLDLQLIAEINNLSPGLLVDISDLNIQVMPGTHPYLQKPAAIALKQAIASKGETLCLNSAYRTVVQQFILWKHFRSGKCNFAAVSPPGKSNHNTGLAIDIEDYQGWKPFLSKQNWKWLGAWDSMHFDFKGTGIVDLRNLSIKAFQILWNKNNPQHTIDVDGIWGNQTASVLLLTPINGFEIS